MAYIRSYYIEYVSYTGKVKILQDKVYGGIKEFKNYNSALKLKNWLLDKGYEEVIIKEIKY